MRKFTIYWLMALNVLLLVATSSLAIYVGNLRDDVKQNIVSSNVGCNRANVQRDATRFLLLARVHDAHLISTATSSPKVIADYFKEQEVDARMKLAALLASAHQTYPLPEDPFLIDCDRQYPLP